MMDVAVVAAVSTRRPRRARGPSKNWTPDKLTTILAALRQCDGNKVHAARALGMSRSGLHQVIQRFGLAEPVAVETLPSAQFMVRLKRQAWRRKTTPDGVVVTVDHPDRWYTVGMVPMDRLHAGQLVDWLRSGDAELVMVQERGAALRQSA